MYSVCVGTWKSATSTMPDGCRRRSMERSDHARASKDVDAIGDREAAAAAAAGGGGAETGGERALEKVPPRSCCPARVRPAAPRSILLTLLLRLLARVVLPLYSVVPAEPIALLPAVLWREKRGEDGRLKRCCPCCSIPCRARSTGDEGCEVAGEEDAEGILAVVFSQPCIDKARKGAQVRCGGAKGLRCRPPCSHF